ncbi:hypothetical protein [Nocardia sp. NPDC059239]|uniref:hypothetical protein n=1 Tax=unclassified Nocardia TaxID=2637762 RepID=UPI0036BDD99C
MRVQLTAARHTLLRHADLLAAQAESARAELAAHRAGIAGVLRISAMPTALAALVAHGFGVSPVPRLAFLPPELAVVRVPLHDDPVPVRRHLSAVRRGGGRASGDRGRAGCHSRALPGAHRCHRARRLMR